MVCLWSRFESLCADFPSVAKYPYVEDLLSVITSAAFIGLLALVFTYICGKCSRCLWTCRSTSKENRRIGIRKYVRGMRVQVGLGALEITS